MDKSEKKVVDYLKENTIAQTKDFKKIGLSSTQIQTLVDNHVISRVSRGIYTLSNTIEDPYCELQLKYTKTVFSHETALSLHNLTDVTPSKITVTVPRNYNYYYLVKEIGLNVVRVSEKRYELGIERMISPFGNEITVTNKERTLCDILLKRNQIDNRIINDAFKNYFKSAQINLNILMRYAKEFKVEKHILNYTEILR